MLLKDFTDKIGIDLNEVTTRDLDTLNNIVKAQANAGRDINMLRKRIGIKEQDSDNQTPKKAMLVVPKKGNSKIVIE